MEEREMKRVTNFIKKQLDVDLFDIRAVANQYRHLDEIEKLAKLEKDSLKKTLLEAKVQEYFIEEKQKVVFGEGRKKTCLDNRIIYNLQGLDFFLAIASVSEKAIKESNLIEKEQEILIAESKETLAETTSPSIKVGKMTQKELKEMT